MIGEGDTYSFYYDDCCFFALGVFFILTYASIFLNFLLLGGQGGVSGISER